jgi:hypothetical protein
MTEMIDNLVVNKIMCHCLGDIILKAEITHKDYPEHGMQWLVECQSCGRVGMIWKNELLFEVCNI